MALKLKREAIEMPLESGVEEEYNPARALDIPPMPDSDEYVYRWIRFRAGAEDDYNNISARLREGWKFVKAEEVPEGYVFPGLESKMGALSGCAMNGDLVLAKLPRKRSDAIRKWAEDVANNAERAYNMRTISYNDGGQTHQFANDGSQRVTRGRKPSFG